MGRTDGKSQNAGDAASDGAGQGERQDRRQKEFRETVESIIIAFILAFLFRTFEAEAFVIPTGSMAPTLRGRHKEADCDRCGHPIFIGASDEVTEFGYLRPEGHRINTAVCPNCRQEVSVYDLPVYKGDRILVNKFPYEFGEPQRWDVFVFKFPEQPKTNYIKRLVGLPDETIELRQGSVYRVEADGTRTILRKDDPRKQRELQILVYDNNHPETPLHQAGWPERWAAVRRDGRSGGVAGWTEDDAGWTVDPHPLRRAFELPRERAADDEYRWIRYRHIVPEEGDWRAVEQGRRPDREPQPELILDFAGYNSYESRAGGLHGQAADHGLYWAGELTLSCQIDVLEAGADGEVLLELNQGERQYRARFALASGEVRLSHTVPASIAEEEEELLATAATRVNGPGRYWISFANVDQRLLLWVDGRVVDFGTDVAYEPYAGLQRQAPASQDLIPAGIAARGAAVRASNLLLERDIYYRNDFLYPGDPGSGTNVHILEYGRDEREQPELRRLRFDPEAWYREYVRGLASERTGPGEEFHGVPFHFVMGPDEFFALGDNSPRSKDSRLWSETNVPGTQLIGRHAHWLPHSFLSATGNARVRARRHTVPRSALVGKAFFIYWPHGVPFLNEGRGFPEDEDSALNIPPINRFLYHRDDFTRDLTGYPEMRVPFYPDVGRMRRIR